MKHKQRWIGGIAALGMLVLIFDSKTALTGASQGIELCMKTVIPSLFPFFLLSNLVTSAWAGQQLPFLRPFIRLFGIPEGAEPLLLSGFLGGYPMGAQTISQAFHLGQLEKESAERLLGFCNNAGPAFIFGMAASLFPYKWMAWALWGIHILSALAVAYMIPFPAIHIPRNSRKQSESPSDALNRAVHAMASVCGWIVLFRVLIAFLSRWFLWLFPIPVQISITGMLELSNGCCALMKLPDISLRFILCSGMLAIGGLCVFMQTASVTHGLSLKYYCIGKLLQTAISTLLSFAVINGLWLPGCAGLLLFVCIFRKSAKNSSIQAAVGV